LKSIFHQHFAKFFFKEMKVIGYSRVIDPQLQRKNIVTFTDDTKEIRFKNGKRFLTITLNHYSLNSWRLHEKLLVATVARLENRWSLFLGSISV
jgi:hypothetical protein